MSILLESLSGKQSSSDAAKVPDINVAHYDDELMGDEWLLSRVKLWQWLSIAFACALVISWGVFYWFYQDLSDKINSVELVTQTSALKTSQEAGGDNRIQSEQVDSAFSQKTASQNAGNQFSVVSTTSPSLLSGEQNAAAQNEELTNKQTYQPQKREVVLQAVKKVVDGTGTVPAKKSIEPQLVPTDIMTQSTTPLLVEELSESMQADFPKLSVGSYVVAAKASESFVILDGAFYKVNQVIAPGLILREITQQHIIVEFKSQRVKIPYNN